MSKMSASNGDHAQSRTQEPIRSKPHQSPSSYQTVLTTLTNPTSHPFFSPPTSPHKLLIPQTSTSNAPTISSLSLHPTIESILHVLNADLPSAHFLCRHAEVAPKWESMYVHGILHRVEGDIDNARAWYGNICETEIFKGVWTGGAGVGGGEDEQMPSIARGGWKHFLDRVERYRDRSIRRRKFRKSVVERDERDMEKDGGHVDTYADGTPTVPVTKIDRPLTPPEQVTDWKAEADALRATSLWELLRVLRFCELRFGVGELGDARGEFLGRIQSGDLRLQKIAEGMITGGEGWRVF